MLDYLKYGEAAEVSVHMQPGNYDITNLIRMSVDDENILMLNSPVGTLWATVYRRDHASYNDTGYRVESADKGSIGR